MTEIENARLLPEEIDIFAYSIDRNIFNLIYNHSDGILKEHIYETAIANRWQLPNGRFVKLSQDIMWSLEHRSFVKCKKVGRKKCYYVTQKGIDCWNIFCIESNLAGLNLKLSPL